MGLLRVAVTAGVAAGLLVALVGFGHLMPWHRERPPSAVQDWQPDEPKVVSAYTPAQDDRKADSEDDGRDDDRKEKRGKADKGKGGEEAFDPEAVREEEDDEAPRSARDKDGPRGDAKGGPRVKVNLPGWLR